MFSADALAQRVLCGAQPFGQPAGLHDGLPHQDVLRGLLGSGGGEPGVGGAQEPPAVLLGHGEVLAVLDHLLDLAGEAPQGLDGQLAGDQLVDGEAAFAGVGGVGDAGSAGVGGGDAPYAEGHDVRVVEGGGEERLLDRAVQGRGPAGAPRSTRNEGVDSRRKAVS